jgi:hypothetical protein
MDFTLSDEQTAVADLAGRILSEQLTPERVREIEADPTTGSPPTLGRAGQGRPARPVACPRPTAAVATASSSWPSSSSRWAAPWHRCPCYATLVLGALPARRVRHRGPAGRVAPGRGRRRRDPHRRPLRGGDGLPPVVPATVATADGDGWRLTGTKALVPSGHLAQRVLVPARTGDGTSTVFLVDPLSAAGVTPSATARPTWSPSPPSPSTGSRVGSGRRGGRRSTGARPSPGGSPTGAWPPYCAIQAGVCEAALRITPPTPASAASSTRRSPPSRPWPTAPPTPTSTPRPSASPPVRPRGASARALPADEELAIAKFWAAEGAHRVVHAAQHLHGGIGVDMPTTRCTAPSAGRSTSSSASAAAPPTSSAWVDSGALLARSGAH